MNKDYLRTNLRFLAVGTAAIASMAVFFLLLSWGVGGTPYFKDSLQGDALLPGLFALIAAGVAAGFALRDRQDTPAVCVASRTCKA